MRPTHTSSTSSTTRFSDRVRDYVKYRPSYPQGVINVLNEKCGLDPATAVADIGSGTGIFTELLLRSGCRVYGIEPNREMRAAAEEQLSGYPSHRSVDGTAESTTLPECSVDIVTAAQAFHWFDPVATRAEFRRIAKPGGWIALIWNERQSSDVVFEREYEALLQRHATDYKTVGHRNIEPEVISEFLRPSDVDLSEFDNAQQLDFEGLRGRALSSSYMPAAGHPGYPDMIAELERLFEDCQQGGQVEIRYRTRIYLGRVD